MKIFILALFVVACAGAVEPSSIAANGNALSLVGLRASGTLFLQDWRSVDLGLPARWKMEPVAVTASPWRRTGVLIDIDGQGGRAEQRLEPLADGRWRYRLEAEGPQMALMREIALVVRLPIEERAGTWLLVDGRRVELPAAQGANGEVYRTAAEGEHAVRVAVAGGWLEAILDGEVAVVDGRRFGGDSFLLRLGRAQGDESGRRVLSVDLAVRPLAVTPVDLSAAANRGYQDEVAGDGAGGWTDQGANDLRCFDATLPTYGGIPFRPLIPGANQGRSCLVFAGAGQPGLARVELPVAGLRGGALHLLHASAWKPRHANDPIARIRLAYADGSTAELPIRVGQEVGDWWKPGDLATAAIAWEGDNGLCQVGLFRTSLAIADKPLAGLALEGTGAAMWMVVGVAVGEDLPRAPLLAQVITAGSEWQPLAYSPEIEAGSILDVAGAGAGAAVPARGPVVVRGDRFVDSASGRTLRLFGPNLNFTACFPSRELADTVALRFRRMGYNQVRLHHIDRDMTKGEGGDTTRLDPALLDRLDYLAAALIRQGMYLTIDLYSGRKLKAGEIPEFDHAASASEFKAAARVLDSAFDNWRRYATNLLSHRNPYTGRTWGDEPAIAGINLFNEDFDADMWSSSPQLRAIYEARFAAWCQAAGIPAGPTSGSHFSRFLAEVNAAFYRRASAAVRALGVTTPLSDLNMCTDYWMSPLRARFDYVDNHNYIDHVRFPGERYKLPYAFEQTSAVAGGARVSADLALSRIYGRPFAVTEFHMCMPNHHRAEAGLVYGAYAALQGWDWMNRFAYALQSEQMTGTFIGNNWPDLHVFSGVQDPITMLNERLIWAFYARGDVRMATRSVALLLDDTASATPSIRSKVPADLLRLGLIHRLGTRFGGAQEPLPADCAFAVTDPALGGAAPAGLPTVANGDGLLARLGERGLLDPALADAQRGVFTSDTGEVVIETKAGTMQVGTARSAALVLPVGEKRSAGGLEAETAGAKAVVAAIAMDDRPLAASGRVLVLHLTDVQTGGTTFANQRHTILTRWGDVPHLVKRGTAAIALRRTGPAQVWAVDCSGHRLVPVASTWVDGVLRFTAATHRPEGGVLAYEVAAP